MNKHQIIAAVALGILLICGGVGVFAAGRGVYKIFTHRSNAHTAIENGYIQTIVDGKVVWVHPHEAP